MERRRLRSKCRGTLLGAAVGDALGAPFEGAGFVDGATLLRLEREPGRMRYTDDTQMTLGLAASLVERRGFDGPHMAATFARDFAAEPWRGYGAGPPQVFRALEQGVPWSEAGRTLFGGTGSFGNGAAMRVAPVALFAGGDLRQVAKLARQTARITHAHELGMEGAVLQACALAWLLRHDSPAPLDGRRFLAVLREHVHTPIFHDRLRQIETLLPAGPADEVVRELGHGIAAAEAVPAALCAFLRRPTAFAEVVLFAIGLGGDTDTIASMAGALAGAYLGEEAIPVVWREGVEGAERLRELADALLALATPPGQQGVEA